MRGMGTLLTMYGQAGGSLEQDVEAKRKELRELQTQLAAEKSAERREKIKKAMESVQGQIDQISEKMKQLLRGAAETASKAANYLSEGAKGFGSKLSSGFKSFGSKLSSGVKTATSDISNRYQDFKDRQAVASALKAEQELRRAQAKVEAKQAAADKRLSTASSRYSSPSSSPTGSIPTTYSGESSTEF
jgi:gas vesicle protein